MDISRRYHVHQIAKISVNYAWVVNPPIDIVQIYATRQEGSATRDMPKTAKLFGKKLYN